jgi:predicted outer membrane protein
MFAKAVATRSALAVIALSVSSIGCRHDRQTPHRAVRGVGDTVAQSREAGGEVVSESARNPQASSIRWITDANALSLVAAMNARAIASADFELENWHIDTVRAFAAAMAREHAELQHSADSIAARLGLAPVSPALSKQWTSAMQAQIDTMRRTGESGLDLAFLRQQANSHQLMSEHLSELASVAEHPELGAFLDTAAAKARAQAQRARSLQPVALSDSTRREAARRHGTTR